MAKKTALLFALLTAGCGAGLDDAETEELALAQATLSGNIKLQAQDFGDSTFDYSDSTPTSNAAIAAGSAGTCRNNNAVDIQTRKNDTTGGSCNIGWTAPGEWLKYYFNVTSPGTYQLRIRV